MADDVIAAINEPTSGSNSQIRDQSQLAPPNLTANAGSTPPPRNQHTDPIPDPDSTHQPPSPTPPAQPNQTQPVVVHPESSGSAERPGPDMTNAVLLEAEDAAQITVQDLNNILNMASNLSERLEHVEGEQHRQGNFQNELCDGLNNAIDHHKTLDTAFTHLSDEIRAQADDNNAQAQKLETLVANLPSPTQIDHLVLKVEQLAGAVVKVRSETAALRTANEQQHHRQQQQHHQQVHLRQQQQQPPDDQPTQGRLHDPHGRTSVTPLNHLPRWGAQPRIVPALNPAASTALPEAQNLNTEIQRLKQQLAEYQARQSHSRTPRARHSTKVDKVQRPEYTNTCMGADTRFEAEQQFIAYAQELTDDCGLNDEGVVRELMKCVPVHMRQEMASYGTIHDVDGFLAAFSNYFTPKIADFFATFMSGDPLQLPHETLKDFVQQRFYQLLLGTRGLPPAGAMVTGSNQNPFWVDFVHHTFTSVYWESAHKAITTLNNAGCDWNSLRTWSAFLQKVPFAGALRDTPERTATAAPPTRTFGAMEVQLPPALPGGMANEPTYTHSQVHQPPNQVNASMLRVMFDDPYPEVNFSSMMRVQSTAAPRQSCCPTTPCHKLSSIVESPPQEPDPAPKPPVPPALLSPTPVLISATTFPESEAETVEAPPPASSPSTGQTRQQMPRQADPIIPDDSQRREQLRKEAQGKLAQSQAISDQQENTRRTTLRREKAQALHLTIADKIASTAVNNVTVRDIIELIKNSSTLSPGLLDTPADDLLSKLVGPTDRITVAQAAFLWQTIADPHQALPVATPATVPPQGDHRPLGDIIKLVRNPREFDSIIGDTFLDEVLSKFGPSEKPLTVATSSLIWQATHESDQAPDIAPKAPVTPAAPPPAVVAPAAPPPTTAAPPPAVVAPAASPPTTVAPRTHPKPAYARRKRRDSTPRRYPNGYIINTAPREKHAFVLISIICRDPAGKILLSYDSKTSKYWFPWTKLPWTENLRPAVQQLIRDVGMNPHHDQWAEHTDITPQANPGNFAFGFDTTLDSKDSRTVAHGSRLWATPAQLTAASNVKRNQPAPITLSRPIRDCHWEFINSTPITSDWLPGRARPGPQPANVRSVTIIDCTTRCSHKTIPPRPNKDVSPPIRIEGLKRAVGPSDTMDGFATVTNSTNTTAIKIAGTNVVIPLDTGHMSSPHPEFYPGQPLRCYLRRAFIQTSRFDRDDFVVAYDPQPVSPTDPHGPVRVKGAVAPATPAQIFARATKLGRPPKKGARLVATTAPTHPLWVGPRHMAVRIDKGSVDSAAESNCVNWEECTRILPNCEAAGAQLLTADALTLVGAYHGSPATIFGVLKDVPIFLHPSQTVPILLDFVVMNGTSPLLLGSPFIDKYVELIQIRKHYLVIYTTPREIRELHDDDEAYFGELLQVPYIVSSHSIALDDTAKVNQLLHINATHVSEQDPPLTPTAAIEEDDEAELSVELAQTSLHPSQESPSPAPDVPTTQLTPSQELVVDELQRQVDERHGNVNDMGAGPSNWDQPAPPDSPNGRPCKAPRASPSSPDTRRHLFRAAPPATRLSPVAHGTPPPQGSPRPRSRSPALQEYDAPETMIGRLISNPVLLHFLVHDIPADERLAQILLDASASPYISNRVSEHPFRLRQIHLDCIDRVRYGESLWDHVFTGFLPPLEIDSLDDVDPQNLINGSPELLSYAISMRHLIHMEPNAAWQNAELTAEDHSVFQDLHDDITSVIRQYAPLYTLIYGEEPEPEPEPAPFNGPLVDWPGAPAGPVPIGLVHEWTLAQVNLDPVYEGDLATILARDPTFTSSPHRWGTPVHGPLDPFLETRGVPMPPAVELWYRHMAFLFSTEPWSSLVASPTPLPQNVVSDASRLYAAAVLESMGARMLLYQRNAAGNGFDHDSVGAAFAISAAITTTALPTVPQLRLHLQARPHRQFGHGRAAVDNFMGLVLALRCVLFHQRQPAHDDEINDSALLPRTERPLPEPLPALSNAAQRLLIPLFPREAHNTWSGLPADNPNNRGALYSADHHPQALAQPRPTSRLGPRRADVVFNTQSVMANIAHGRSMRQRVNLDTIYRVIDAFTVIDPQFSTEFTPWPRHTHYTSRHRQLRGVFNITLGALRDPSEQYEFYPLTHTMLPIVALVFDVIFRHPHQAVTLGSFADYLEPDDLASVLRMASQWDDSHHNRYNDRIRLLQAAFRSIPTDEYEEQYANLLGQYGQPLGNHEQGPPHNMPQ